MTKVIIIPDLKYKSPKRRGRGSGHKGLRSTLKYLEYREDRDERAKTSGEDRWVDCGLGKHYREIFANCDRLKSQHVLAWTWVISPAPDLMTLVPEDKRRDLVMDVTERIVEAYYETRGFQTPPYAYVTHDRLTKEGDQQLHTHVILPGLAPTVAGWEPIYNHLCWPKCTSVRNFRLRQVRLRRTIPLANSIHECFSGRLCRIFERKFIELPRPKQVRQRYRELLTIPRLHQSSSNQY